MHILAQSSAQLAQRWGEHGAAAIMNNAGAVVIFGGTKDEADLRAHSTLIGDREERVITRDHHGKVISETTHRVPIFSPAQLAQLPQVPRGGDPPRPAPGDRQGREVLETRPTTAPCSAPTAATSAPRRGRTAARSPRTTGPNSKPPSPSWSTTAADLARQLREQYQQAAARRAQRRAQQAEAERAAHESIDPQPAGPDRHEPAPDRDREDETGEGGDRND